MKKIQFYLSNLKGGGAQRTVVNILRYINKEKFEPELILLDYDEEHAYSNLIPEDINIYNLNTRGRYSILKISKLIKERKPDICFATLPQVCKAVMIGHKLSGSNSKTIFRETTYRNKDQMSFFSFRILKTAYNYCSHNISLTKGVKEQMIKNYDLLIEKVTTIYNPIDIENIKKKITEHKFREKDNFTIIACGRLAKVKNFSLLIKASKILKNRDYNDIKINIMGKGRLENELKNLINELNVSDMVSLLGFKRNPFQYMSESDLFILSSLWEGFGHVIVESMASGTPVLSTDCPYGPKEILVDNEYGWLVPNDDAEAIAEKIIDIYNNPADLEAKKDKAIERAKDFDASNIVKQYEKLFLEVLE